LKKLKITPKLDKNIVFFARLLRASGISIGSDSILEAIESIKLVDIKNKKSFFYALQTCFIKRPEDMKIFAQAFSLFWQNPRFRDRMRDLLLPQTRIQNPEEEKEELAKRIQDTLSTPEKPKERVVEEETLLIDTSGTASDTELFNEKDFEMMSKEEIHIASQSIKELLIKIPKRPFRRSEKSYLGLEVSARESLRRAKRNFGSVIPKLVRKKEVSRPVVVLLDISGSMENYSRMMIHFVHNLMQKHKKVHAFLFGTKLTNISFQMKNKDIDVALKEVSKATNDWAGGTRIRDSIFTFNKNWVRRVSSSNSIIFLITDGLDRDHSTDLFNQMERLQKSCYKLVWLNPLLRFTDFLPKSISIKRILLNVDAFLPIHSIESMQNLTSLISKNLVKEHNDIITWHNKIEPQSKGLV
jgi:uncharacterized protein with von Willebrand factor type A (vWA) domain